MNPSTLPAAGTRAVVGFLCAALAVTPVLAQSPVLPLSDLVNQGSAYAQREMLKRNYVFTHAGQNGSKTWQYWWQNNDKVCARVALVDGRASSIVSVSPTECNQHPTHEERRSGGMSTGAKVAIGAAALLGVAALAHRSHERDESKHNNEQQVAEYERGYRDGLYHQPYHDYSRSQSYVDGYNAGQQKRDEETRYRSPHGHHSGHAAYVQLNDLIGARASGAEQGLGQRGFVSKGGYQSNNKAYGMWWNAATRQCVQTIVSEGRLQAINAIVEGNCL
jgi:hypothetical protein